jgi:pSer/pThr/pTyr-binding forkhead associated (FHA) protein
VALAELEPDGTVQLLPGRLEIVNGADAGRSIPFMRPPSHGAPEITLGRAEGQPYHHVQIADNTVSRMHARLRLEARRWTITNLSSTNPVRVNGHELTPREDTVLLTNGDRIQLGAIELRFREGAA